MKRAWQFLLDNVEEKQKLYLNGKRPIELIQTTELKRNKSCI